MTFYGVFFHLNIGQEVEDIKKLLHSKRMIALCLILTLLIAGILWQFIMVQKEQKKYQPVGEFADLGSYQAHYVSKGDGDSVFVFITGSGTPCAYTDFYNLQDMLSTVEQTITFDHAGSGWSSSTDTARSIDHLTEELSILIEKVAPEKSVILICHSLGSLEAISYAQSHPENVKGIIFLDSGSPEFYAKDSEFTAKILNRSSAFIRTVGINRLFCELGLVLPLYGEDVRNRMIPSEVKELDRVMYERYTGNAETLKTVRLMNENAKQVLAGSNLGDLPIMIISSDSGSEWNDVQIQLATWSTNSESVRIENSKHYIYWSNYDEVSKLIMSFTQKKIN